jgi:4-hydroxyphenylacetate 3-monooxygenase
MSNSVGQRDYLKDGATFKESLRDGRTVIYQGATVDDVTTHFATAGGISQIAEIYDEQFNGERDALQTGSWPRRRTCRRETSRI